MEDNLTFRIIRPPGKAKPNKDVLFRIVDANSPYAKQREQALLDADNSSFSIQTRRAPTKRPRCGTTAVDYREEHPGEELLLPTGHPFACAVCGNTDYWT